ncbi:MAG: DNA replication and repair protein RecF [Candidatus Andersenbacteria bacterium]|nr:DNA replication and repair protein RecF [Candidatus Andersenbacteria bacterium]
MDLCRVALTHFRNLGCADGIELPRRGLLVAAAPNAAGKTNFLESVAVLLRGKSFRARIEECTAWGYDSFLVAGELVGSDDTVHRVAVRYHRPTRRLRVEEAGEIASVVAFYSHYPYVLFLPQDTFLFSRGPEARRTFLNQALVAQPHYLSALVQYHRVLRQRNALLKRTVSAEDLQGWTELLGEHAAVLWQYREGFVTFLGDGLSEMYRRLSGEEQALRVRLEAGARRPAEFAEDVAAAFAAEAAAGYTLLGPHRDDVAIDVRGRPVRTVFSRGQMRSLVATLKILTHAYLRQVAKEEPLLLLDDVLSELDEDRQRVLLENLPATQTLLTCTAVPRALREREDVFLLDVRAIVDRAVRVRPAPAVEKPRAVAKEAAHAAAGERAV